MYWASTMALCGWGPLNKPLPQIVVSDLEQLQGLVVVQKSKNGNFCVRICIGPQLWLSRGLLLNDFNVQARRRPKVEK